MSIAGGNQDSETLLMQFGTNDSGSPNTINGVSAQPWVERIQATEDREVWGLVAGISSKAERAEDVLETVYQIGPRPGAGKGSIPSGPAPNVASDVASVEQGKSNIWFTGALTARFDGDDTLFSSTVAADSTDYRDRTFLPSDKAFFWEEGEDITFTAILNGNNSGGTGLRNETYFLLYYDEV